MCRLHVVGEPSEAQAQHARGEVGSALPRGQDYEAGVLRGEVQAAASLRAAACQPSSATQVPPSVATWRRTLPNRPENGR